VLRCNCLGLVMPTKSLFPVRAGQRVKGFSLIELIVFIVVVSIALVALLGIMNQYIAGNVDPVVQERALECAQAKMDQIWGRKFDDSTPSGGLPPCGSAEAGASACTGISPEASFNDIGDYHNTNDTSWANCSIDVTVTDAGQELGLTATEDAQVRRITVTANSSGGGQIVLSAYRANF
jgi:MSHA pilin protein MshD